MISACAALLSLPSSLPVTRFAPLLSAPPRVAIPSRVIPLWSLLRRFLPFRHRCFFFLSYLAPRPSAAPRSRFPFSSRDFPSLPSRGGLADFIPPSLFPGFSDASLSPVAFPSFFLASVGQFHPLSIPLLIVRACHASPR